MLKPELEDRKSESITPDGGIVKYLIKEADGAKAINWVRGSNAKFYYTAHAYIIPTSKEAAHDCKSDHHNCSHTHGHTEKTKEQKEADLQEKVKMIQSFLEPKPKAKNPSPPVNFDPNVKPVRTLIAESRKNDPSPFELRIGYSFSVKAMEICVKTMKVGERSRFLCMPEYCEGFIQLETVMRQEKLNKELVKQGKSPISFTGCVAHASPELMEIAKDLDSAHGMPMEFEIELVQVQNPDGYVREPWEMEPEDRYKEIPIRKQEGAELYKAKDWQGAMKKYERCIVLIESLNSSGIVLDLKKDRTDKKNGRNDPSIIPANNTIDLDVMEELERTCRLNYAACQLKLKEFASVVGQCTKVLSMDPNSVKALFRRGQAYCEIGRDLDLAMQDFDKIATLVDPNSDEFKAMVSQRNILDSKLKAHAQKERQMFKNIFD